MDKIVIYDTETTNSTIWGSIIEVGAVVVDKNLKEIGKLNICLLYTSPSPRDLSTSRMPSSA